jgi:hypothetical protein
MTARDGERVRRLTAQACEQADQDTATRARYSDDVAAWEAQRTDADGYFTGVVNATVHEIDEEVPDDAHWKGWLW